MIGGCEAQGVYRNGGFGMYLSYYNLQKKPFQISTDPEFLWFGEKHKEALATLKYGILDNKGFLLLTGDVGTGKTTLINALVKSLGDEVVVARVPDPGMESMDLMNFICHSFRIGKEFVRKDLFLVHFSHFLNTAYTREKKSLLIIDEAQRLSQEMLEEVRQLSNIEREESKLLNIFLIGQNEFTDMLQDGQNEPLLQRITLNYHLQPMDLHETGALIKHRLRVAGGDPSIFNPESIREIFACTKGIPRRINVLCDHCLISGFVRNKTVIDGETVLVAAEELRLPPLQKNPPTVLSGPDDISEDSENSKYYKYQELLRVLEPEELLAGNDGEEEPVPVPVPANAGWSWMGRSAVALAFVGMISTYIYMSTGTGDPAYQIKQVALQLIGVPESRTKIFPAKQKVFKDTVSPVVHEREPLAEIENSGMSDMAIVLPVTFKPTVQEKEQEPLSVPAAVEEHALISSSVVASESVENAEDKGAVGDSAEVLQVNDGLVLNEELPASKTEDELTQAASIAETVEINSYVVRSDPDITEEKTVAESVEVIAEHVDNVVIESDRSAEYVKAVDSLEPDTHSIAKADIVDIGVGDAQSAEVLLQDEDVVSAEVYRIIEGNSKIIDAAVEQISGLSSLQGTDSVSVAEVALEETEMPTITSFDEQAESDINQREVQDLFLEKISIATDSIDRDFQAEDRSELLDKATDSRVLHEQDSGVVVEAKKMEADDIKTARAGRDESSSKNRNRREKPLDSGKVIDWLLKKKNNK
ncbi:ExeA family protein [Desulfosediminicola flagellatus]|uniref:ExeA family protein n=1 Tax=Desulfosediminicola flagellatus TaxID=2569541 RepID=UPI001E5EFE8A|nr:AAA family ATPase [Desulfosediminicola flagellatus]